MVAYCRVKIYLKEMVSHVMDSKEPRPETGQSVAFGNMEMHIWAP
jgi:hypothetical protein